MTEGQKKYFYDNVFSDFANASENKNYHTLRSSFYDKLDKYTTALVLAASAAPFAAFFSDTTYAKYISLLFFIYGIVQLTFGFSKKISLHDTLKSKYADIQGKMILLPFENDEIHRDKMLIFFKNELSNIYKDEPKDMLALKIIARNQFINSHYQYEQRIGERIELNFYHKWFAQVWSFDTLDLTMNKEKNQIAESKEK